VQSAVTVEVFFAGVQKGGTTSLFAHCREHPELVPPRVKEPHFFDDETVDWSQPDYGRLDALYPDAADAVIGKRFDSTPIYSFWPPSAGRIAAYNPEARIAVLFRDPIERAWSHWVMEFGRGYETLQFGDAIRQGRERLASASGTSQEARVYSYVERGFYAEQVERLLQLFPRDQLLFLRSKDLADGHQDVLARIAGFLDIGSFPASAPKREHVMPWGLPSVSPVDVGHLRGLFRDDVLAFSRLSGVDVSDWLTLRDEA
jgi:hypothetical protein